MPPEIGIENLVTGYRPTMALLREDEIEERLSGLSHWHREGDALIRTFDCGNFVNAVEFVESMVKPAEAMGHHPDLEISWKHVKVKLSTHSQGGITAADFELAHKIDDLS